MINIENDILNNPFILSRSQQDAVLSTKKYIRVLAGAGAGKTETLIRRILHLILCRDINPAKIVAFTFTDKAANNMRELIYFRLSQIEGLPPNLNIDEMFIGTIHSYSLQILRDFFEYGIYNVLDENQEIAYLMRNSRDLGINNLEGYYANNCLNFHRTLNMVYNERIGNALLNNRARTFSRIKHRYENELEDRRQLTFSRIMHLIVEKTLEDRTCFEECQHLLIDEFQDINESQMLLIRVIAECANLFVVGDPRQCIYQWRGSKEDFFNDFANLFPNPQEIEINTNRRSRKQIVELTNSFAETFENQYTEMDFSREEDAFIFEYKHLNEKAEASWIADQIEVLTQNGVNLSDIAILLRSVNTSGTPFIEEFRSRNIPFLVGGKVGLFKREEAIAIGKIIMWIAENYWIVNPYSHERLEWDKLLDQAIDHWNISTSMNLGPDVERDLINFKNNIRNNPGSYSDFITLYHDILTILHYQELSHNNPIHIPIIANLGRLSSLLTDYEVAVRLRGESLQIRRELKNLSRYLNSYAIMAYEEQTDYEIESVAAVQITTIHQAKGLQWNIVFIPSMLDSRFPSSLTGRAQNWCDVPDDMFNINRYQGTQEDEKKVFYVAMTRAKDALILSYFEFSRPQSRYLADFNRSLIEYRENTEPLNIGDIEFVREEELLSFAVSGLVNYHKCPYKYLLQNAWGYTTILNQMVGFGNAIHYCLEIAANLIKSDGLDPISAIATAVDEHFHLPYIRGAEYENARISARRSLIAFAKRYGDDLYNVWKTEYEIKFPLENSLIRGIADVILKDNDEYEIRDYKTSTSVNPFEEIALQIQLYAIATSNLGFNVTKGSIAYMQNENNRPAVLEVDVSTQALSQALDTIKSIIQNIKNKNFTATPETGFCLICDFRRICRWNR